jgi:hypothetical protein
MHGPDSDVDDPGRLDPHTGDDSDPGDGRGTRTGRSYQGRHREEDLTFGATRRRRVAWPVPVAFILTLVALGGLGFFVKHVYKGQSPVPASVDAATLDRTEPAARSLDRGATPFPSTGTVPSLAPTPSAGAGTPPASPSAPGSTPAKSPAKPTVKATTGPRVKPSPTKAAPPAPVGGLTQQQMNNAATIVKVGQQRQMPKRAYVIAIATALQESYLRNLANGNLPESMSLPNEGLGYDHDSVGLFQQRPSSGWGTVAQCMTPSYSAGTFYERLALVFGWESMSLAAAAQAVQISAFPDAYAKHEPLATQIVDALT